ncbi:MAG: hypothetical protein ACT4P1_07840 [Sporichthyaceae bacterium]
MGVRTGVAYLALECRLWGQALHNSGRRMQLIALGVVAAVALPGAAVVVAVAGNSGSSPTAVEPLSVAESVPPGRLSGTSERTGLPATQLRSGLVDGSDRASSPADPANSAKDDKRAAKPAKAPARSVVTAPAPAPPPRSQPVSGRTPPRDSGAGANNRGDENDKNDSDSGREDRKKDDEKRDRDLEAPIAGADPADPNSNDEPQVANQRAGGTPPNELPAT